MKYFLNFSKKVCLHSVSPHLHIPIIIVTIIIVYIICLLNLVNLFEYDFFFVIVLSYVVTGSGDWFHHLGVFL